MGLICSEQELVRLDEQLEQITKGLPIEAGSLFRVPFQYLKNWGVKVTEKNTPLMEARAEECNQREWKYGGSGLDNAIHNAVKRADLDKNNIDLNTIVGDITARIFESWDNGKRRFFAVDIGAGAGDTTEANLDKLGAVLGEQKAESLVSRLDWCLNDQSLPRLYEAHEKLEKNPLHPSSLTYISAPMASFLGRMKEGLVDIFVSSAVFHHMPSTTHLLQINDKLKEDGILVIGDWYHTFCAHPAYTLQLLFNIGAGRDRIDYFKKVFNVGDNGLREFQKTLSPSQIKDNDAALLYLTALADEMRHVKNAGFYFLESLESFEDRKRKLREAGFETEIKELRKKHQAFVRMQSNIMRAYPNRDITSVIAAAKVPRRRGRIRR